MPEISIEKSAGQSLVLNANLKTYRMIILRGAAILPDMSLTIDVARDRSLSALNKAIECNEDIFVVAQKHANTINPGPKDVYRVGTVCRIRQITKMPSDIVKAVISGVYRAEISTFVSITPHYEVSIKELPYVVDKEMEIETYMKMLKEEVFEFSKTDPRGLLNGVEFSGVNTPEKMIGFVSQYIFDEFELKQQLLNETELSKQLEIVYTNLVKLIEIAKLEKKISAKVRKQIDKNQKEYYLREQVRALHEELGEGDEELSQYLDKAKELKLQPEIMTKVEKEVKRLQKMSPSSPDASVSRTYIEWILDLPWNVYSKDNTDLKKARAILDEDHFGLTKVKERILEYLAVLQRTKSLKGPILCFVGPPGVGKTSIVRSIARTLDRKFVSMSLGGVRDEAEIRGHRRTYIGAIPGRIIYHIKQAGTCNPVFLFDEIDKMSSDFRGDPASAMLEVLDPEQNFQFRDHYLELPFDLSKVMFVTTANTMDSIPAPLRDRMEIIELSGYTEEEKIEIAKNYLAQKQLKAHSLETNVLDIDDKVYSSLIQLYTRESGVRSLEREISNICRKATLRIVENGEKKFVVTKDNLHEFVGIPKYKEETQDLTDEVGAATGLAWTAVGGKTLTIEVTLIKNIGKGEIILTGSLGDVMKESCRAAVSLIRANAEEYNILPAVFTTTDIHLHVPEGATPKDGPSAGITIATALLSAFTGRPVSHNVAMTGELTLRGKVLAIGGLKEKILAAHRLNIKSLIIPQENEKDLAELPANVVNDLNITLVSDIKQVFEAALI